MTSSSLKQTAFMATVGVIALYAAAVATWFLYAQPKWVKAKKTYEKSVKEYHEHERLISQKQKWTDAYENEKSNMPMFEIGKATDTTWLGKMDEIAQKNHILIGDRQYGKEVEAGDVLELPIEVRSWEGSLESLVHFLHELENTSEGMFDVKAITMRPSSKKGFLRGSFSLTCAYMRTDEKSETKEEK